MGGSSFNLPILRSLIHSPPPHLSVMTPTIAAHCAYVMGPTVGAPPLALRIWERTASPVSRGGHSKETRKGTWTG